MWNLDGTFLTYEGLLERAREFQDTFQVMGLPHGDRVALLLGDGTAILAAALATHRSGLYAVPINTALTDRHQAPDAG